MTQKIKLWLPVPVAIQHVDGLSRDGAYRDIRNGKFPFRTKVIAGRIHVSARDLGLLDDQEPPLNSDGQPQGEVLQTAA